MNVSTVTTEQSELIDTNVPSAKHPEFIDRPVTESVTARAGSDTNFPDGEYSEIVDRPVTELVTTWAGSDTDFPSGETFRIFRSTGHGVGDGMGQK